jgi:glyoxylase-like metal-dependent hydrolase (beta-lactamase superfamily II)
MLSPGHTLASITYVRGDTAFVHDTLMYPDAGTSRADFPGGDAEVLWDSIQALLALPGETRLPPRRAPAPGGGGWPPLPEAAGQPVLTGTSLLRASVPSALVLDPHRATAMSGRRRQPPSTRLGAPVAGSVPM